MRSAIRDEAWIEEQRRRSSGLTLFELLVVILVVGLLAALSAEIYAGALARARTTRAVAEIRSIEKAIQSHTHQDGTLPETLGDVGMGGLLDPWGTPYQFVNFAVAAGGGGNINGIARKDRFLVPINSTYDLFSMGPDRESKQPLTARHSRDDIIRAADGAYIGLAEEF